MFWCVLWLLVWSMRLLEITSQSHLLKVAQLVNVCLRMQSKSHKFYSTIHNTHTKHVCYNNIFKMDRVLLTFSYKIITSVNTITIDSVPDRITIHGLLLTITLSTQSFFLNKLHKTCSFLSHQDYYSCQGKQWFSI